MLRQLEQNCDHMATLEQQEQAEPGGFSFAREVRASSAIKNATTLSDAHSKQIKYCVSTN